MDDNLKQSQKDLLGACSLDRACPAAAVTAVAVQTVLAAAAAAVGVAVVVVVVFAAAVVAAVVVVSSLVFYCHAGSTLLDDSHLSCEKTKIC